MKSSDPTEPSRKKLAYFQPRQMVYLITHERDLRDDQLDRLIAWSNESAGRLHISRHRVLSFPATKPQPESPDVHGPELSSDIQYKAPEVKPRSPFTLIFADVKDKDDKDPAGYVDDSDLVELIIRLDDNRAKQPLRDDGISLELVSPSWLSSAGSETGGTGGPGGRPEPYTGASSTASYQFTLPREINALCPQEDRGKGVKVAILDTAPCLHDLAAAYERWQKVDPRRNPSERHRLIETLLRPNGPLRVHPASYDDLLRMRSVHLEEHNYKMTDHGLFVAGIIHSIAPSADIHLYEVLNPDGVGDIESIAMGLWNVAEEQYRVWKEEGKVQRLVVNCSLVLNVPLPGHPRDDLHQKLNKIDPEWLERQGWPIEWICDLIYAVGSRVIAAAGNDRKPNQPRPQRPQARYPAALETVVGVGALRKRYRPAEPLAPAGYSNLSDRPKETGITTFGGEGGEEKGVLGIYLGEFPSSPSNPNPTKSANDWAWWCGTSFATPIISGVTAAVLSVNPGWTTQQAIEALYNAQAIVTTPEGEDVLDVTQG